MANDHPIVLTTDFGLEDSYVGVMKGVILGINPGARFIDLTHQISPQNVGQAAYVLGTSYRFFPPNTIHVVVVDPLVGTNRLALLLVAPHGRFLAPDNGVLSYVLRDYMDYPTDGESKVEVPGGLSVYSLTNSQYWLDPVSQTFHGRDIFAPVAAHLSTGVSPEGLGELVKHVCWLPSAYPMRRDNGIYGEVINVDHFGNLVTNVPDAMLVETQAVNANICGQVINGLSGTFNDGGPSSQLGLIALVGSSGFLEIALPGGNAAAILGADVGEPVGVTFVS